MFEQKDWWLSITGSDFGEITINMFRIGSCLQIGTATRCRDFENKTAFSESKRLTM